MKSLSYVLLLSVSPLLAMEQSLQLDQTALQEFLANKKQMVQVSQEKVDEKNPLFKRYVGLSQLDEHELAHAYKHPTMQEKVTSFYQWLSSQPSYQSALAIAKTVNTQEAWESFRNGNGPLVQRYFDENGIKTISTSCADFFNGNNHLNAEQVEKVVAQSFVIYYIRQLQRQQTPIAPAAIAIK